jgi:hypothetical protein
VTEAPMQFINEVQTITIEKMLVDILVDESIFVAQQGSEMQVIFKSAIEKYGVNKSKMLRYADRRRKKEALEKYLHNIEIT